MVDVVCRLSIVHNQIITLLKVPLEAFKVILKYIYTGKINLRNIQTHMNLILDVLGLSNLFGYGELKDEISNFLKDSLQLINVCNILDASRLYDLHSLESICYTFIDKHAEDLLHHESFKCLYKDSLIIILGKIIKPRSILEPNKLFYFSSRFLLRTRNHDFSSSQGMD